MTTELKKIETFPLVCLRLLRVMNSVVWGRRRKRAYIIIKMNGSCCSSPSNKNFPLHFPFLMSLIFIKKLTFESLNQVEGKCELKFMDLTFQSLMKLKILNGLENLWRLMIWLNFVETIKLISILLVYDHEFLKVLKWWLVNTSKAFFKQCLPYRSALWTLPSQ